MPSGDLGDESDGNTRPSAERFQSAILICMPLRGGAAQRGVQGFSPAASPVAERRSWGRKRRKNEALRRAFPERHTYLYAPARRSRTERGAGLQPCRESCRRAAVLGTKATEKRGFPPSVSIAPCLSVCPCAAEPHREGCRALALPRVLSPSGGLGDESDGKTRPSAECFHSAILICMPLRGGAAQRGVTGL